MNGVTSTAADEQVVDEITRDIEKYSSTSFWQSLDLREVAFTLFVVAVIFIVGSILIRIISSIVSKFLRRAKVTTSGIYYIDKVLQFILYFILITIIANNLGIQTGSLVALIASLGFAVALALQGSLTDLASGIMIVLTKPIQVGEYVYLEGHDDLLHVEEIRLYSTVLRDRRNMSIIIANEMIMQKKVQNLSKQAYVYADVEVSVAYSSDIARTKELIRMALDKTEGVLREKDYLIGVNRLNESGVDLLVSAPCIDRDHAKIKLKMRENILNALCEGGIEIPFPQMDVRVINGEELSQ